tara:strand:+ start:935 stop:1774 length:840 start_codon:yes stop_codon:yes gene_type:complete
MVDEHYPYVFIYFKSFLLGIIQGITEFLPVSSTAHLRVFPYYFGWSDPGVSFSASLQLGSAFAVIYYFRNDITLMIHSLLADFSHRKVIIDYKTRLYRYIFIANIPIFVFGLLIKLNWTGFSESNFRGLFSIAIISILMSVMLAVAEICGKRQKSFSDIHLNDVILLGISQSLALFPGVSRSGITLTSALFSGIERKTAARLSFLVGIPAISISGLVELITIFRTTSLINIVPTLIGIISSLISSLFAMDLFLKFVSKNNTFVFVYYRLAFGVFILSTL